MHMSDYNSNLGYCKDEEHAYYAHAKDVWNAMTTAERTLVSSAAKQRLSEWARINGDSYDGGTGSISRAITAVSIINSENTNAVMIVVIISVISVSAIGGYFFLRKRREEN